MRDSLGLLLVAAGIVLAVLRRDKLALAVAFVGLALLVYGVLKPARARSGPEPPIL